MKEVIKSKTFKIISITIGVFLVLVIIFGAGVAVGFKKAKFSNDFGKNYEQNFMGSRFNDGRGGMMGGEQRGDGPIGGMMGLVRDFEGRGLRNAHGLAGTIISIDNNNVVVKDRDNKENTVTVNDQTLIKSQQDNLKVSDLKVNDQIVVMGNPGDNGMVNANLIRVFTNDQNNNQTNNQPN